MKTKLFLSILISAFCALSVTAQNTFQKTYGGTGDVKAIAVKQTSDGGYIIVGNSAVAFSGNSDVYLVKTNANGDTLWTRYFGGLANEFAKNIVQTNDGGYIVVGYSEVFGAGLGDVYVIKTNPIGVGFYQIYIARACSKTCCLTCDYISSISCLFHRVSFFISCSSVNLRPGECSLLSNFYQI